MPRPQKYYAEIGHKYGRLIIKKAYHKRTKSGKNLLHVDCICDCGNEKTIAFQHLARGNTKSCGCLHSERSAENIAKHQHKCIAVITTHGKSKTKLYNLWGKIKGRCYNENDPSYHSYGGKGIVLCDEWLDFAKFEDWSFKNGYQPGLSIDRIDPYKIYEPTNCQWITISENSRKARLDEVEKTKQLIEENNFLKRKIIELESIINSQDNI